MQRAFLLTLLAASAVAACGGGGGNGDSAGSGSGGSGGGDIIDIVDNEARIIQNGDVIEYQIKASGSYSDGSSPLKINGKATVSYSGLGNLFFETREKPGYTYLQLVQLIESDGQSSTTTDIGTQDAVGNLYALSFDDGDCVITEQTFDTDGAPLQLPGTYVVGFTYNKTFPMICKGGATATYTSKLTVLANEKLDSPIGTVDTFKVSYTIETSKNTPPSTTNVYNETGTVWVNPKIGIIKQVASSVENPAAQAYTANYDLLASDFNYDP